METEIADVSLAVWRDVADSLPKLTVLWLDIGGLWEMLFELGRYGISKIENVLRDAKRRNIELRCDNPNWEESIGKLRRFAVPGNFIYDIKPSMSHELDFVTLELCDEHGVCC